MMRASTLVRASRRADLAAAPGLEPGHLELLDALSRGPQRITELADTYRVELSTVSRRISRLSELGLVSKASDPADRRVQLAQLSTSGEAVLDRVQEQRERVVERVVGSWSAEDVAELERLLDKMAAGFEAGQTAR